jgi:hypothetical protein
MSYITDARNRLTSAQTFYVSPSGSDSNDGLTSGTPKRQIHAVVNMLKSEWDLGGFPVTIEAAAGTPGSPAYYDRVHCAGLLPGQVGPIRVVNAGGNTHNAPVHIRGNGTAYASAELAYGAFFQFEYCTFDATFQGGVPQDNLMLGKGATVLLKHPRFYGNLPAPRNHITMAEGCRLDFMQSFVWLAGDCQCFISMDQLSSCYWHTDGQINVMAMGFEESPGLGRRTRFWTSFIRVAGQSNLNMQNIDYHGWAGGTWDPGNPAVSFGAGAQKVILQDFSVLDLNGLGLGSLPGGGQGSTVANSIVK